MPKLIIPADKVETALLEVEDLLMEADSDPDLLTDDQRGALRAFEAVGTTAVENGWPVTVDYVIAEYIVDAFKASLEAFDAAVG